MKNEGDAVAGKVHVVVDGQFGSCGKGAIAGWLTHQERGFNGLAVRVAGPNAGHTVVDKTGRRWPLRCIPVAAVTNPDAQLLIAAGSEVDLHVLMTEVNELEQAGHHVRHRLFIDPAATVLENHHAYREKVDGIEQRSGSTAKGVGAARADRIMRIAATVGDVPDLFSPYGTIGASANVVIHSLIVGNPVLIEGTQGYGLGLHTPYYPHTTSQDCRAIDFLAQVGISPWSCFVWDVRVWLAFRPNPIRIAGNSGPLKGETTWEALGLEPEQTTVTKMTRRVGEWDAGLAWAAARANGAPSPNVLSVLTMADHIDPAVAGVTDFAQLTEPVMRFIARIERDTDTTVGLVGTGPDTVAPKISARPAWKH